MKRSPTKHQQETTEVTKSAAHESGALPMLEEGSDGMPVCKAGSETWLKSAMAATGTTDPSIAKKLLSDAAGTFSGNDERGAKSINQSMALIHGIGPRDELEGMLAAQMVGVHNLTMTCLRKAACEGQTSAGIDLNVNRATKLLRASTALVEALTRYRSKGKQKVQVEHVHVHQGGQAIVGDVHHEGGGGGNDKKVQ